jgi:hypothetical protein
MGARFPVRRRAERPLTTHSEVTHPIDPPIARARKAPPTTAAGVLHDHEPSENE